MTQQMLDVEISVVRDLEGNAHATCLFRERAALVEVDDEGELLVYDAEGRIEANFEPGSWSEVQIRPAKHEATS